MRDQRFVDLRSRERQAGGELAPAGTASGDGQAELDGKPSGEGSASRHLVDEPRIGRLKRRADFVRAAQGKRWHGKAMTLQAGPHPRADADGTAAKPRVGFTLTKKVGCAVIRNRARRRLKEAVRLADDLPAKPGHDYVIVGRIDAIRLPFDTIKTELTRALTSVHDEARAGSRRPEARHQRTRPKP